MNDMNKASGGTRRAWRWVTGICFMAVAVTGCATGPASLNGLSLVADPYTQSLGSSKRLGYLADGEAVAFEAGDVFSFAPIALRHGKTIGSLRCVMKDNTSTGYVQVNLIRGPINTVDPVVGPSQVVASVGTTPSQAGPGFVEFSAPAQSARATVDNTKYGYFLRVDFLDGPGLIGPETTLSLRGCIVEYAG